MRIKIKSNFNHRLIFFGLFIVLVFTLSTVILFQHKAQAQDLGPPGCSTDKPFKCAMKRETFDQQVSQWCGLAKSDKQTECRLTFFSFVHHKPNAVQSNANIFIPDFCGFDPADLSDQQRRDVPTRCYVMPKRGGKYYLALKKIHEECGPIDAQDANCVRRIQQQFLHDHDPSWADEPDAPGPADAGTGGAINIKNDAGRTLFFRRVASYIKWLSLGIGILAVFGLVISGIQYAAAQDNPQAVSGAKTRIYNIVIGIAIFATMFGLLQWLIPGGVFTL